MQDILDKIKFDFENLLDNELNTKPPSKWINVFIAKCDFIAVCAGCKSLITLRKGDDGFHCGNREIFPSYDIAETVAFRQLKNKRLKYFYAYRGPEKLED